jgi:hypothetical protein
MDEVIDLARQKKLPFRVNRGQEIDFSISVNNADGTDFNFTGYTAEMYVYNSYAKTDTPEYTITVTLSSGTMTFTRAAITRKKENFIYKLWITDAGGYRQIWTNGPFLVLDSEVDHEDGQDTIIISPDGDAITLTISPVGIAADGSLGNYFSDLVGTDTYTITISGLSAYTDGLVIYGRCANANTGPSTLNGLPIWKLPGFSELDPNDMVNGGIYQFVYDEGVTCFQILNPS